MLIDIGLPGMDGCAPARELRSQPGTHAVSPIAQSGYGHEEARKNAHAAGFDDYLVKPASMEDQRGSRQARGS